MSQQAQIGTVPDRWNIAPLIEFLDLITYGFTNPMPTTEDGPFKVTAADIRNGRIDYHTARHTSLDAYKNELTDKSRPKVGDVLLTKDGSIGRIAIVDRPDICINQSVALLRPKGNITSQFLKYLLTTPHYQQRMAADADGSTILHIYITRVDKMQVAVPPLPEQKRIAHILGTLDDKIELNRRMNETLEAMARALFKSWFVDPAQNGLPKGWKNASFDQTINIHGGGTPKTSVPDYWDGEIPWFSVVDAPADSDVFVVDTEKKITQAGLDNSSTKVLPIGATIISARGTVGKVALVGVPMAMNQSCYGLTGKVGKKGFYTYYSIKSVVNELRQGAHGSVFDTITRETLSSIEVPIPPAAMIERFEALVEPIMDQIKVHLFESRTLAAIRDALLPKLLSGEIRV